PTTVRPRTSPPPRSTPPPPPSGSATAPSSEEPPAPELPPQDLSGTWGYSKRRPRTPRYVRKDDPTVFSAPNPIGFYSGVSVAGNHVPPRPPDRFDSKPATLTWAGFERAQEGSRVFFQLNAAAQYSVEQNGLLIVIKLRNTKVNVRNNTRALDLRYFKTPVRTVKVRRRGRDTTARIVLKREASPQIEIVDGKEGYKLLVVQFADAMAVTERTDPTQKRQAPPKVAPLSAASGN
ncbi:MAG: AMIN domain-containing protein, partial [Myxococcota bacterium]